MGNTIAGEVGTGLLVVSVLLLLRKTVRQSDEEKNVILCSTCR